ncbi:hypothetical protein [Actinomadura formosensis]|uniref:hypothetical protein n=1 Tax=Actinomadura formosensis TaxID=60706 RepID=UPI00082E715E|nr:hypothetical protein [Actinomadura formosensis]
MGLRERLVRFATACPHVFVVTVPGATRTRLLLEAELRRRRGRPVASPAAATTLVVCGTPGPELGTAVDTVWSGIPAPRALVRLEETASAEEVAAALDRAARELADVPAQWAAAAARSREGPWAPGGDGEHDHMSGHGHGGHEHGMEPPMGLAMAGRADDRDGLKLDVLHVPLGPALKDWPAGLVLRLTLQGDIVQDAEAGVARGRGGGASFWDEPWLRAAAGERVPEGEAERRRAASHLDSVGRLLAVAGWENAADRARGLRDDVLAARSAKVLAVRFAGFARRTRQSRTLRWMLRDVGGIDRAMADRHGLAGPEARHLGDVFDRLSGWLDDTGAALARADSTAPLEGTGGPRGPVGSRAAAPVLDVLPELLGGAELAAARLIVAGLDPDLDRLAEPAEAPGE